MNEKKGNYGPSVEVIERFTCLGCDALDFKRNPGFVFQSGWYCTLTDLYTGFIDKNVTWTPDWCPVLKTEGKGKGNDHKP